MDDTVDKEQQVAPGTPVYDAGGAWVGIVSLANVPGPSLVVQKGRWFPKNIHLPAGAIRHADEDSVVLRLSGNDLKHWRGGQE